MTDDLSHSVQLAAFEREIVLAGIDAETRRLYLALFNRPSQFVGRVVDLETARRHVEELNAWNLANPLNRIETAEPKRTGRNREWHDAVAWAREQDEIWKTWVQDVTAWAKAIAQEEKERRAEVVESIKKRR